jgi:putative aldouronate transport system substrate-binding protein
MGTKKSYVWKRQVYLVLSIILAAIAILSGCSDKSTDGAVTTPGAAGTASPKASADDPYAKLPKTVSISTFDRGLVSSDEGTYEENRWTKWIKEQSGIDVKIVPVPRGTAQDKLNVLLASGQAPDMIWEFDRNYIGKLVTQGSIQPLDEYIEKYSTSYKKYLAENPELKPYVTFDGKMYAFTSKRTITTVANHGIWIRQDWLDKLKLKAPTTTDELIAVAQAFKTMDPDGNKIDDTVAIMGSTTSDVISAIFGVHPSEFILEDGKIQFGPLTDRYRDGLGYEKKLYDLGLLDKEYLTDKNNQRAIQNWTTGKSGICLCNWGGGNIDTWMLDLKKNIPTAVPVPMEPVASKYGKYGLYQETQASIYVTFNKEMKNPKAAVEYLDWIIDKGWYTLANGIEGTHYKLVNGVAQITDQEIFKKEVSYAGEYAVLRNQIVKPEDLLVSAALDPASQELAKQKVKSLELAMKNKYRRDFAFQPNITEINELKASFHTVREEIKSQTILGGAASTEQKAIDELRKEWDRLGGKKADELAQQWYDANKDLLLK